MYRNNKAITLIALAVTMIILLILAGVSLSMLVGEEGIITQSKNAKINNEISQEKEYIDLATSALKANKIANEDKSGISVSDLQTELDNMLGTGKAIVSAKSDGILSVYYIETKRDYDVKTDGTMEIDWSKAMENAVKHPDQDITNSDIAIGTDGESVNLNLWYYYLKNGEMYVGGLSSTGYLNNAQVGYLGNFDNGKIEGKFPQYIKYEGTWYPVTRLGRLFATPTYNQENLKYAPELPSTVKELIGSFYYCNNLLEVEIPNGVESIVSGTGRALEGVFAYCSSLKNIEIPESVTNIENYTFTGCSSLENINIRKEEDTITGSPWSATNANIVWNYNK